MGDIAHRGRRITLSNADRRRSLGPLVAEFLTSVLGVYASHAARGGLQSVPSRGEPLLGRLLDPLGRDARQD